MGACDFTTIGEGKNMTEAFRSAVSQAQYDHGHSGYSGTIAEKHDARVIQAVPMERHEAHQLAGDLIEKDDPRIMDKWGPAGAIRVKHDGEGQAWLFFGYASM